MNYKKLLITTALPFTALFAAQDASAHISYTNLQTNTFMHTTTVNPDGSSTYYNDYLTVMSNGGWADATDADQGNSHNVLSWSKFQISNPGGALVNLSVVGDSSNRYYSNGTYNTTGVGSLASVGGFTPAFTLYGGLLPNASHDDSVLHLNDGKEGAVQALADTTMGNGIGDVYDYDANGNPVLLFSDPGTVGTIDYLAHAGSVDGGTTSASLPDYYLVPGWYTLVIGGSCYTCQIPDVEDYDLTDPAQAALFDQREIDAYDTRGFSASLTVTSVPVPAATWMMGSGLLGLLGFSRRKSSMA
jgi:hypothetical protein